MKTKIVLFSILSLFLFSCSGDDDNSGTPQIPAEEKLIDYMNFDDALNVALTYNSDKTVETINFGGQALFLFTYANNQISTAEVVGTIGNGIYTFAYDDAGRISSISLDDQVIPVVWNEANRSYLFQRANLDEVTIILKENNDIGKVLYYDDYENETKSTTFFYEESKKGTMTNSNQISIVIEMIFPNLGLEIYTGILAKKPIKSLAASQIIYTIDNSYDEQGFVSESTMSIGPNASSAITYKYTQLN